jgi:hypothetical protein
MQQLVFAVTVTNNWVVQGYSKIGTQFYHMYADAGSCYVHVESRVAPLPFFQCLAEVAKIEEWIGHAFRVGI